MLKFLISVPSVYWHYFAKQVLSLSPARLVLARIEQSRNTSKYIALVKFNIQCLFIVNLHCLLNVCALPLIL